MLRNAYFRDSLEKYGVIGDYLRLKIFRLLLVEKSAKISPVSKRI
jgi:hypothetical protein